jgi:hypothetical protein
MQNEEGVKVDLYIPRKCSATNRLITAKDHASIQIAFANVDESGKALKENTTFAICGFLRAQGRSDEALNRLTTENGLLKETYKF